MVYEQRRLDSDFDDPPWAQANRFRAYMAVAAMMIGFVVGSIAMIASGNAWLAIVGVVLLLVTALALAGFMLGWRRPTR